MSMENLRRGAQSINSGKGKGGSRSAFFAQWRPPQIAIGAGMGKNRITFDLRPFLAAPPSEESKTEAAEAIVLIPGEYEDVFATFPEGHPQADRGRSAGHEKRVRQGEGQRAGRDRERAVAGQG